MGIFMLGLPVGLVLAYFSIGAIVNAFGTWRAPFYVAMVPGLILAATMFFIKEPARGASEETKVGEHKIERPIRKVLSVSTLWWIIAAGIFFNMSSYAANSFMVPLLQRYFGASLEAAAIGTGVILGISGLIGLTLGATVADRLHKVNETARLTYGALSMFVAAALTWFALRVEGGQPMLFVALFALGWLLQYNYYSCAYPAIQDVIEPRLRATAMAIFFAALYLLGGAAGPLVVGVLSDRGAAAAMTAAGATQMTEQFKAIGLHDAMAVVPITLLLTGIALVAAGRTFSSDAAAMRRDMAASGAASS
jgi:MFS family permease